MSLPVDEAAGYVVRSILIGKRIFIFPLGMV
jgi:hypothetical protein